MRLRQVVRRVTGPVSMATAHYLQPAWTSAEAALADRLREDADEFCTVAWREWLTAMVVVEMARSDTRVSWH